MSRIEHNVISALKKHRKSNKFLCNAPFASMNIFATGIASPCCYTTTLCENYYKKSINEIFNGKIYKQYRKSIRKGILPDACSTCMNSISNGECNSLPIFDFDHLKVSKIFPNKLRYINISLSNICNLECIMCNGIYSSCIRKNREKQNPINLSNKHKFRKEIKSLIPNLQTIVLVGGEPFFDEFYYSICEDIIRLNPQCSICVTTNGTILNNRIKQSLEKGNFYISVSFNGITKRTYEAIHVNANFEETKANLMYFGNYMKKNNKILTINICPLKLNKFEIPDLVRFCNQNNFYIDIAKVRGAIEVALFSSTEEDLIEIKKFYQKQVFEETNYICKKNISEFNDLIHRIDYWIELAQRKNNFMNLFDLNTDKIAFLEEKLFDNLRNALNEKDNNDNEIQLKKNWQNVMIKLPPFFKSNHFYQQLLDVSPVFLLEFLIYGEQE